MRSEVLQTLEVYKYACVSQVVCTEWNSAAIANIEAQIICDPALQRLHALIFHNAIKRDELQHFSKATQTELKLSTYKLIADIGSKNNELKRLSQTLKNTEIEVLLLKGLAFNDYIYNASAPRGSSDIDILVNRADKAKFVECFAQLATVVELKSKHTFDGLFEETWRATNSPTVYFDLHWYLSYPSLFQFDEKAIMQRSKPHSVYTDGNLRLLSDEDHLVYLATHLLKDCDFYHYGLIDCHELICQKQPNLALSFSIADNWGVKTGLYYLLKQCSDVLQTPISNEIMQAHKPHYLRNFLCRFTIIRIFSIPSKIEFIARPACRGIAL